VFTNYKGKKSKKKFEPVCRDILFVDDVAEDFEIQESKPKVSSPLVLDIPKPVVAKREMPMILNTK